jgi:vacuolar-type H+-ATPase subunit E/Vma4
MDERNKDAEAIVAGILADADAEAAGLLSEAADYAAAAAARAADQAATIEREASAKSEAQARAILADAEAKAAIERRKRSLASQESLAGDIVAKAAARVAAAAADRPAYRDALRGWIVEAAIGLSAESATVNASKDELPLIDDELLREAEREVLAATGKATRLCRVDGDPTLGQGVYLLAEGGRLAYDNRAATRFERGRSEIRKRVYEALYGERARATGVERE